MRKDKEFEFDEEIYHDYLVGKVMTTLVLNTEKSDNHSNLSFGDFLRAV